jgi:UDP-glucose 4-epimerase
MGALTLLVTGGAGFVGRAAIAEALRRGHRVATLVRGPERAAALRRALPDVEVREGDLTAAPGALAAAAQAADCVIHCAGTLGGDHGRDTGAATTALLDALPEGGKLVHVSSIAVHDFAAPAPGTILDETAPLESRPETRDAYAAAKIAQERAVVAAAERKGLRLTLLRPGAIFGPGRLWHAHLGKRIGPVLLRFGRSGQIPLAHIDLTAAALVAAAERPATDPVIVVGEDLPDRLRFLAALEHGPRLIVPLPQALLAPVQSLGTRAARYRPFGFDNARLREALGVRDGRSFEQLMRDAQRAETQRAATLRAEAP